MSTEIASLEAKLSADVASFQRDLKEALGTTDRMESAIGELTAAVKDMGQAAGTGGDQAEEGMERAGQAAAKTEISFRMMAKAAHLFAAGIKEAIADANEMDPAGAKEWEQSLTQLRDAAKTFAGTIGKELRPALEAVMHAGTEAFRWMSRIDFGKFIADVRSVSHDAWEALAELGGNLGGWAETVGRALLAPFQLMKDAIVKAVAYGLNQIGNLQDLAKQYLHVGEGGFEMHAAAEGIGEAGKGDIFDGITGGLQDAVAALKEVAETARSAYVKDSPAPVHHFQTDEEKKAGKEAAKKAAAEQEEINKANRQYEAEQAKKAEKGQHEQDEENAKFAKQQAAQEEKDAKAERDAAKSMREADLKHEGEIRQAHGKQLQEIDKDDAEDRRKAREAAAKSQAELSEYLNGWVDRLSPRAGGIKKAAEFGADHAAAAADMLQGLGGGPLAGLLGSAVGPVVGAVAAALAEALAQSKQFAQIGAYVEQVTKTLSDTLGSVLEPFVSVAHEAAILAPVAQILGVGLAHLAESLPYGAGQALQLAEAMEPFITSISPLTDLFGRVSGTARGIQSSLSPFTMLGEAVGAISAQVDYVATGFDRFAKALDPAKEVTQLVTEMFRKDFGPSLNKVANELATLGGIFAQVLRPELQALAAVVEPYATLLAGPVNQGLEMLFNGIRDFAVGLLHFSQGFDRVLWQLSFGTSDWVRKAGEALNNDDLKHLADQLQHQGDSFRTADYDAGQAADQVATMNWKAADATEHLAKAANAAAGALSNVPEAYKIAQVRDRVLGGGLIGGRPASVGTAQDEAESQHSSRDEEHDDDAAHTAYDNQHRSKKRLRPQGGAADGGGGIILERCTFILQGVQNAQQLFAELKRLALSDQVANGGGLGTFPAGRLVTSG